MHCYFCVGFYPGKGADGLLSGIWDGAELCAFDFEDVLGARELDGVYVGVVGGDVNDDGFGRDIFGGGCANENFLVEVEFGWSEGF